MDRKIRSLRLISVVGLLLATIVIAGIILAAWLMYSHAPEEVQTQKSAETSQSNTTPEVAPKQDSPTINDTADLQEAEEFLKETQIDDTLNTSEIDAVLVE